MNLTTKFYKLYFVDYDTRESAKESKLERKYVLVDSYADGISNSILYNINIKESSNSQYELSFETHQYIDSVYNKFLDYLIIDREIHLILDSEEYDFYITNRTPSINSVNSSYKFVCQDSFSYSMSKSKTISLSTNLSEDWADQKIKPRTIKEIGMKILEKSNSLWKINEDLNNIIIHFPDNLWKSQDEMKVSFELNDVTPYNALTELAKVFNAIIKVNFNSKKIYFINKEKLSYQGLTLRPDVNISNFSFNEEGNNLYNIMNVIGGEDAYGGYVSIVPNIPQSLSSLLLELTTINNFKTPLNDNEYYSLPTFFNNGTNIYQKKRQDDGSKISYSIDIIPNAKNWKECKTITELKDTIDYFWNLIPSNEKANEDKEKIDDFFHELKLIPHAGAFLYDFSYWKESGLLSSARYDNLLNELNINLRNINLLQMAYQSQYNYLYYDLQKIVQQEEEYLSMIAAEDNNRANYTSDINLSKNLYYIGHATAITKDNNTNYYIPIAWLENNICYYGSGHEKRDLFFAIPDIDDLLFIDSNVYIIKEGEAVSSKILSINSYNNNFVANFLTTDTLVYINYEDLKNSSAFNEINSNIDGLIDLEMYNLEQKLGNLHTSQYYFLWNSLFGQKWLNDRKSEIISKISEYKSKKSLLETKLIAKFGKNWRDIGEEALQNSTSLFIEYSDLTKQLQDIEMQIGGTGTRKYKNGDYYTFKGYLEYYLLMLNSLTNVSYNNQSLSELLTGINKDKDNWFKNFYSMYTDVIRETIYTDNEQLTNRGLYLAAEKQFNLYKNPTKSYKSSVISTDNLVNVLQTVNIGDIIHLHHNQLNIKKVDKLFKICLNEQIDCIPNDSVIIELISNNVTVYIKGVVRMTQNNDIIIESTVDPTSDTITSIFINDYRIGFQGSTRILNITQYAVSEKIEMRVTAIDRNLKSGLINLTIEENTLYNTLIDRLLTLLS